MVTELAVAAAPIETDIGPQETNVPKGYKQTEVGIIPADWHVKPLGDTVTFLDGMRRPVKSGDRARMRGSIP